MELQRFQTTFPLVDRTLFPGTGSSQSFTKGDKGVEKIDALPEGVLVVFVPEARASERWTILITPLGWGRVGVEKVTKEAKK